MSGSQWGVRGAQTSCWEGGLASAAVRSGAVDGHKSSLFMMQYLDQCSRPPPGLLQLKSRSAAPPPSPALWSNSACAWLAVPTPPVSGGVGSCKPCKCGVAGCSRLGLAMSSSRASWCQLALPWAEAGRGCSAGPVLRITTAALRWAATGRGGPAWPCVYHPTDFELLATPLCLNRWCVFPSPSAAIPATTCSASTAIACTADGQPCTFATAGDCCSRSCMCRTTVEGPVACSCFDRGFEMG